MNQNNTSGLSKMLKENKSKRKKLEISKFIDDYISKLSEEEKLKFWIKTLLSTYSTIPEIIKTLDKIIELQASSVSFMSDIYNQEKSTFYQVEKVIDLSERKNKLLNIYIMTKKLTNTLSLCDMDFIEKKFMFNWTTEDLAKEFNISLRTVYRRTDKIINLIYEKAKKHNWSLLFLESQIRNESWLKEKFYKQVSDYFKISNTHQLKEYYSQSSSESYVGNCG